MTYANGEKYVGQWRYYDRHGKGNYTYVDGRVKEGIWEYGALISAKKPSPTVTDNKSPIEKARNSVPK